MFKSTEPDWCASIVVGSNFNIKVVRLEFLLKAFAIYVGSIKKGWCGSTHSVGKLGILKILIILKYIANSRNCIVAGYYITHKLASACTLFACSICFKINVGIRICFVLILDSHIL